MFGFLTAAGRKRRKCSRRRQFLRGLLRNHHGFEKLEPRVVLASDFTVSGLIQGTHTWHGTVHVTGNATIGETADVTIQPGTVIKTASGSWIDVVGKLTALGNQDNPVTFTSWRDDAIGAEVSDPGPDTAQAGDWESIYFTNGDTSVLEHVVVQYAGAAWPGSTTYFGALELRNADVTIRDASIHHSDGRGIHVRSGSPQLERINVDSARQAPFQQDPAASPVWNELSSSNSQIDGVWISPGTVTTDVTWSFAG